MQKVYLLGHYDQDGDIRYALLGPEGYDVVAAERNFQKENDLYYPFFVPDASLPVDQFQAHWEEWRDGRTRFLRERSHLWPDYGQLFESWLVRHCGFTQIEWMEIDLPSVSRWR